MPIVKISFYSDITKPVNGDNVGKGPDTPTPPSFIRVHAPHFLFKHTPPR